MNKKIGIWGIGIVGKAAIRYFYHKKYQIQVTDRRTPTSEEYAFLAKYNAQFLSHEQLAQFLEYNDHILPSCGIDLRPYTQYAHKWLSELDLFGRECTKPIIAITGSVGKTTVTHLLSSLLAAQGKKVFTGGNIGVGLLDAIQEANECDAIILEVSSFQLERCTSFAPDLALCTNIYANHLDRHGSMEAYVHAKLQILAHQTMKQKILFPLECFDLIPMNIRASGQLHFFSSQVPLNSDLQKLGDFHTVYFLHNLSLMMNYQTNQSVIYEFKHLPDVSYMQNCIILASTLHILDISLDNFAATLEEQELPEHRLEKIATINGIDFYNDSKATIPASTLAAIEKIKERPIVLFLGGVSKGVNRADMINALKGKVRAVFCFGKEADELTSYCQKANISSQAFTTLQDAFYALPIVMQAKDQILFSPAGASFDLFSDYKERGNCFKKLVLDFCNKYNS